MRLLSAAALAVSFVGCGDPDPITEDAGADGPLDDRVATGTRLVDHPAVVGGLTSDGHVVFSDLNADDHTVARVIPIGGGAPVEIAASTGTGKVDIRVEIAGGVVFAWTDRGNRSATLTIWSAATGVVAKGPDIRPGRAAATADGAFVIYERDVTAASATIVAGPIAGDAVVVGPANAADSTCWRDTDFASAGSAATQRLIARYCPDPATAFALRSVTPDGSSGVELSAAAEDASYRPGHVIWREAGGALRVAAADGNGARTLATDATDYVVSDDETEVAWLTTDGAIRAGPLDGGAPRTLVEAPAAVLLGALSPDKQTVLFASQLETRAPTDVGPYTDVLAGRAGQPPRVLVPGTTSCPGCLRSSFTPDSRYALVLDPIDNSADAEAEGTVHAFSLADGAAVASLGEHVYSAIAVGPGAGAASRLLLLDAVRDPLLVTGWRYGLTLHTLDASAAPAVIARGAEDFVIDAARTRAVVSFPGTGDAAGVWVSPLR